MKQFKWKWNWIFIWEFIRKDALQSVKWMLNLYTLYFFAFVLIVLLFHVFKNAFILILWYLQNQKKAHKKHSHTYIGKTFTNIQFLIFYLTLPMRKRQEMAVTKVEFTWASDLRYPTAPNPPWSESVLQLSLLFITMDSKSVSRLQWS